MFCGWRASAACSIAESYFYAIITFHRPDRRRLWSVGQMSLFDDWWRQVGCIRNTRITTRKIVKNLENF